MSFAWDYRRARRVATRLLFALTFAFSCFFAPNEALAATAAELQSQLDSATEQLNSMMEQTNDAIDALQETQADIEEVQQRIEETRSALNQKAIEVANMQDGLAAIIAADYKTQGDLGLLGFILGAKDYDDLISRVYYAERVSGQQERSLAELRTAQEEMMAVQRDLQDKKASLEELAAQQESQIEELQTALEEQQAFVDSLPGEIQQALAVEEAARIAAAEAEVNRLVEEAATNVDPRNVTPSDDNQQDDSKPASSDTPSTQQDEPEPSTDDTPKPAESQPPDPTGGSLADVANYIGPQASWSSDTGYIATQQSILNGAGSGTDWGCVVDKGYGRCIVFHRDGGVWKAAMTTDVITNGHTFTGTFSVVFHSRAYWKLPDGYDVNDWWVCFIAAWSSNDYNGHLRYEAGKGYDDGQGFHYGYSTGGCTVIPSYSTSQWLYDHVPDGSRVIVH